MYSFTSADDIKASFTFPTLDRLDGEPTYDSLNRLETQATRNASTVSIRLAPPHTNLSGLVEQPTVYVLRTGGPFPRPPYPGDRPAIPPRATDVQRQNIINAHAANMKNFLLCHTTESILKTMLENAIEPDYIADIYSETLGFGNRSLIDIFAWLYATYGKISVAQLQQNFERLNTPVPGHLPIAVIFKKIADCQKFATAGNTPFTDEQIVKAAENLVLATGRYHYAYREWVALPDVQKTYQNFRTKFSQEYQLQNAINATTAEQGGYANNISSNNEMEMPHLTDAIDTFAQAAITDQQALAALSSSNENINNNIGHIRANQNNLQNQIQQLQQQIQQISLQQAYHHQPVQAQVPFVPAPPMMFNQQHQNQVQHQHRAQRPQVYGGRNSGRGQRFQRAQTQAPTYNPNVPYAPNLQQYAPQQQARNQFKRFANWNYCSTHGYDVDDFHTSETCQNPGPRHNFHATRDNPIGGSNKNKNKIFFPYNNQHT